MKILSLNKILLLVLILGINFSIYSQHGSAKLTSRRSVKKYLKGNWYEEVLNIYKSNGVIDTAYGKIKYTFSFIDKYNGWWTQPHVHSTAEMIKLVVIKDTVNIRLYDILGDYSFYNIKTLNKKELVLEDNHGDEIVYFREYDQLNRTRSPQ